MPKFRVGDRVRFTDQINPHNWDFWVSGMTKLVGGCGTVTEDVSDVYGEEAYRVSADNVDKRVGIWAWNWLAEDLFPEEEVLDFDPPDDLDTLL